MDRILASVLATAMLLAACSDASPPILEPLPDPGGRLSTLLTAPDGTVYESDTGLKACTDNLRGNYSYWHNIPNVGARRFTFYGPHRLLGYFGRSGSHSLYRYEMNYGRSHDGAWAAEGIWIGSCKRIGDFEFAVPGAFEGSVWRIAPDPGDCDQTSAEDNVSFASYDPYYEGGSDCGWGGGNGTSGRVYQPGEYTGGETVDWSMGAGNGGHSACEDNAKVEYVCIDYWNGGEWVQWGCGYVTTC